MACSDRRAGAGPAEKEGFVESDGFRDRHDRYSYLVHREIARRLVAEPALVDVGRKHLERVSKPDPRQRDGYRLWTDLLADGAARIAERLTERSTRGDYARQTAPAFAALAGPVRTELLALAHLPLQEPEESGARAEPNRMAEKVTSLDKVRIAHLLRAAAGISQRNTFVLVGSGAVIARAKHVPLGPMATREIGLYVAGDESASDLIEGSIGEGSPFDAAFGYYAHGVGPRTACLPDDWAARATDVRFPDAPGVTCVCPDANDIALSKLCAWRDKDRSWLQAGLASGLLDLAAMRARVHRITNEIAPAPEERVRRLNNLAAVPPQP